MYEDGNVQAWGNGCTRYRLTQTWVNIGFCIIVIINIIICFMGNAEKQSKRGNAQGKRLHALPSNPNLSKHRSLFACFLFLFLEGGGGVVNVL